MIVDHVAAFIEGRSTESLDQLARRALAFQLERMPEMRRLCARRGVDPARIHDWREVPAVPASVFKSLRLCAGEGLEVFRSSGTTAGARRSVHHHPFPTLYRTVIDASFPPFCLPRLTSPPALSLIPPRALVPDSSLSFMVDHVLQRFVGDDCLVALGRDGVRVDEAIPWLERRQRTGEPGLVLATALALLELLEGLEQRRRRFRLPPGTVLFETGGFKGKTRQVTRAELVLRLSTVLGVESSSVVREYGMTELTSQAYTRVLFGEDPDLFFTPPWLRAHVLEPIGLAELPPGETGLLALFDLANVGSALHLLTEDLGSMDPHSRGFRLAGRAAGAELRGCSLTAEELGA